jgi:hypothetical protein
MTIEDLVSHCKRDLEHPRAIFLGEQEGFENLPSFRLGECLLCKTSFLLGADYVRVPNEYYVRVKHVRGAKGRYELREIYERKGLR